MMDIMKLLPANAFYVVTCVLPVLLPIAIVRLVQAIELTLHPVTVQLIPMMNKLPPVHLVQMLVKTVT
jgi:hypothetical protein